MDELHMMLPTVIFRLLLFCWWFNDLPTAQII